MKIIVFVLCFLVSPLCVALECIDDSGEEYTREMQLRSASKVFLGRVVSGKYNETSDTATIVIKVSRFFKGEAVGNISLEVGIGGAVDLGKIGSTFVVSLNGKGKIDECLIQIPTLGIVEHVELVAMANDINFCAP